MTDGLELGEYRDNKLGGLKVEGYGAAVNNNDLN